MENMFLILNKHQFFLAHIAAVFQQCGPESTNWEHDIVLVVQILMGMLMIPKCSYNTENGETIIYLRKLSAIWDSRWSLVDTFNKRSVSILIRS